MFKWMIVDSVVTFFTRIIFLKVINHDSRRGMAFLIKHTPIDRFIIERMSKDSDYLEELMTIASRVLILSPFINRANILQVGYEVGEAMDKEIDDNQAALIGSWFITMLERRGLWQYSYKYHRYLMTAWGRRCILPRILCSGEEFQTN